MRNDPAFSAFTPQQMEDASTAAFASLRRDARFDDAAHAIALLLTTREEREAVLRAARAALVADGVSRDQENDAIVALASAMGLDVRKA
jgi:tellurite resistance protein